MTSNEDRRKTRRAVLKGLSLGTVAASTIPLQKAIPVQADDADYLEDTADFDPPNERLRRAYNVRIKAARSSLEQRPARQRPNGEERDYPLIGVFTKSLNHNSLGEVNPVSWREFTRALRSGNVRDFEGIPMQPSRRLVNPLGSRTYSLTGKDPVQFAHPPAPRFDTPQGASEQIELYWMALLRDVPFAEYGNDVVAQEAIAELNSLGGDYQGGKENGSVTTKSLFRGTLAGDLIGPYISQFLYLNIPTGSYLRNHLLSCPRPGENFLTSVDEWLRVQNGLLPSRSLSFEPAPRYIISGRDMARYVQLDFPYQAFLDAALYLCIRLLQFDSGLPYETSRKQIGFVTFEGPHLLAQVAEMSLHALRAVWHQKWFVHLRLRPEEYGGRVHQHVTGAANYGSFIHPLLLNSKALQETLSQQGSGLLSSSYPEGCPIHPSYGSGHSAIAGACATMLKAWFDESFVLREAFIPTADGTALVPYDGADRSQMTIGGELNKLASNIGIGRLHAGLHYRSDHTAALQLGEEVALAVMAEACATTRERHSFTITKFDGTKVTIAGRGIR